VNSVWNLAVQQQADCAGHAAEEVQIWNELRQQGETDKSTRGRL